jgi:hypothetical protein
MRSARGLLLPIGLGLLPVLAAVGLFAMVPGALARQDAYAAAPACTTGTRSDSCRTAVPATVRGTEDEAQGKAVREYLLVTERGTETVQRIRMAGTKPVYQAADAGEEVTLTYWRGKVRTVTLEGASQATHESPSEDWRYPVALGFLLLSFGLSMIVPALGNRHRSRSAKQVVPWQTLAGISVIVGVGAGFPVAMMADGLPDTLVITAVAFSVIVPLTTWFSWRAVRRANNPVALIPGPGHGGA